MSYAAELRNDIKALNYVGNFATLPGRSDHLGNRFARAGRPGFSSSPAAHSLASFKSRTVTSTDVVSFSK